MDCHEKLMAKKKKYDAKKKHLAMLQEKRLQLEREKDQREYQILEDHKRSVNSSRNSLINSYMTNNQNTQSGESVLYQQNNRSAGSVVSGKTNHYHCLHQYLQVNQMLIKPKTPPISPFHLYRLHKYSQNQTQGLQTNNANHQHHQCHHNNNNNNNNQMVQVVFITHQYSSQIMTFPLKKFKMLLIQIRMTKKATKPIVL